MNRDSTKVSEATYSDIMKVIHVQNLHIYYISLLKCVSGQFSGAKEKKLLVNNVTVM